MKVDVTKEGYTIIATTQEIADLISLFATHLASIDGVLPVSTTGAVDNVLVKIESAEYLEN